VRVEVQLARPEVPRRGVARDGEGEGEGESEGAGDELPAGQRSVFAGRDHGNWS